MQLKKRNSGLGETGWKIKDATDILFGTDPGSNDRLYDMRSGALLTFVLLLLAGWIPFIGQMVAGYIGGRKAGSPYRGLAATAISTIAVIVLLVIALMIVKATVSETDAENASFFLAGVLGYLKNMFGGDLYSINYGVYFLTIVFGIIGGIISDQIRREMSIISRNGGRIPGKHYRQDAVQSKIDEEPKSHKRAKEHQQEDDDEGTDRLKEFLRAKKEKSGKSSEESASDEDFSRYL